MKTLRKSGRRAKNKFISDSPPTITRDNEKLQQLFVSLEKWTTRSGVWEYFGPLYIKQDQKEIAFKENLQDLCREVPGRPSHRVLHQFLLKLCFWQWAWLWIARERHSHLVVRVISFLFMIIWSFIFQCESSYLVFISCFFPFSLEL